MLQTCHAMKNVKQHDSPKLELKLDAIGDAVFVKFSLRQEKLLSLELQILASGQRFPYRNEHFLDQHRLDMTHNWDDTCGWHAIFDAHTGKYVVWTYGSMPVRNKMIREQGLYILDGLFLVFL